MKIADIVKKIKQYLKREDRKDVEFRALIALTELGDIVKYITHDKKLNPDARPYGTRNDEKLAYGQALIQTIATMVLRGINVEESIRMGLENWAEAEWRKRGKKENKVSGILAFPGQARGRAYVLSPKHLIEKMPANSILVAPSVSPALAPHLARAAGIITDHGGLTSHAAIMSREKKIPCLVGAGNTTALLRHGSLIRIVVKKGKGFVEHG